MKKISFLFGLFIFVYTSAFCCLSFVCLGADYKIISDSMDNTLRLKEAGDIGGAISSIQRVLLILDTLDSSGNEFAVTPSNEDIYTKEYLRILIECLKANEITYTAIIKHIISVVKKTKELFFEIADELKAGKLSAESASSIKEMKFEISRAMVTHSFCVQPDGYKEVYNAVQAALFWYSKAWRNLYLHASEQTDEKGKIGAEALLSFQKGNELFSQAGTLMLAIPTR